LRKVKEIIDLFHHKNPNGKKAMLLTGGEIFVYDYIDEVIEYALNRGFVCQLQTNGRLIPEVVKRRPDIYSNQGVRIKISLDGWNAKTHEQYRGHGTFGPVVIGIKSALSINPNVGVKTVIHEGNLAGIKEMLDFCLEMGVKGWSYNTLMERGRSRSSTSITEMEVTRKIIPLLKKERYRRLLNGTSIQTYLWLIATGRKSLSPYFFINSDGGIYITDKTIPERQVGSIYPKVRSSEFSSHRQRVIRRVDLTIESEMLELISSHFRVKIERSSL